MQAYRGAPSHITVVSVPIPDNERRHPTPRKCSGMAYMRTEHVAFYGWRAVHTPCRALSIAVCGASSEPVAEKRVAVSETVFATHCNGVRPCVVALVCFAASGTHRTSATSEGGTVHPEVVEGVSRQEHHAHHGEPEEVWRSQKSKHKFRGNASRCCAGRELANHIKAAECNSKQTNHI